MKISKNIVSGALSIEDWKLALHMWKELQNIRRKLTKLPRDSSLHTTHAKETTIIVCRQ